MHEIAPRQVLAYAVLAILIGIVGARYARSAFAGSGSGSASAVLGSAGAGSGQDGAVSSTTGVAGGASGFGAGGSTTTTAGGGTAGPVAARAGAIVDVAGAVRHPGVYRLAAGARIDDALRRAGGPTRHADLDPVNLAAPVADGQQIMVPRRGHAAALSAPPSAGGSPASAGSATPASPIDLNTASADQLDTIDGVGPATAQKILAYRQQHEGFRSVQELLQVSGIGPKKLAAMRPFVRV